MLDPIKTPLQMMYENAHLPHYAGGGKADILEQFAGRIQQAIKQYTRATGKAPSAEEVKALEDHIRSLSAPAPSKPVTQARLAAQEPHANQFVDASGRPYQPAFDPTTRKAITPERAAGTTTRDLIGSTDKRLPTQFDMEPANLKARTYADQGSVFPEDNFMSMANTGRASNRTWNKSFTPSTEELAARQQLGEEAIGAADDMEGGLGQLRATEGDIPQMTSASEPFAEMSSALEGPAAEKLADELRLGHHGALMERVAQDFRSRGIEPDQEDLINGAISLTNPMRHNYTGENPIGLRPSGRQGIEAWRDQVRAAGLPETVAVKHPSDWKPQHQRDYLLDTAPEERGSFASDWDINNLEDKRRKGVVNKATGGMMKSPRDMHAALMVHGYAGGSSVKKHDGITNEFLYPSYERGDAASKVLAENYWNRKANQDSMKAYEPSLRERIADTGQAMLEKAGIRRPIARRAAQTVTGGDSSALPMKMGLIDTVGMVNPVAAAPSVAMGLDEGMRALGQGDYVNAALGLGFNAPQVHQLATARRAVPEVMNREAQIAQDYMKRTVDRPYNWQGGMQTPSNAERQEWIGRSHAKGAEAFKSNDPAYKAAVYASWLKANPEMVKASGAQNYDELMKAAYDQAIKETQAQARVIPNKMEWWKDPEYTQKDYLHLAKEQGKRPAEFMREELSQGKPMYVYGDNNNPHPYLSAIDPETGASANELFRGVHDYFGHLGTKTPNTFGPKGEENTWMSHRQMFSDLAEPALTAETRGQNSWVNYVSPENKRLRAMGKPTTEFASNVPVLLPAEASNPEYMGGLPDYLKGIVK